MLPTVFGNVRLEEVNNLNIIWNSAQRRKPNVRLLAKGKRWVLKREIVLALNFFQEMTAQCRSGKHARSRAVVA